MIEKLPLKFSSAEPDPDTKLRSRNKISLDGIDCLVETWSWDGILAGSAIFHSDDITRLSDNEVVKLATRAHKGFNESRSKLVYGKSDLVFVNFHDIDFLESK